MHCSNDLLNWMRNEPKKHEIVPLAYYRLCKILQSLFVDCLLGDLVHSCLKLRKTISADMQNFNQKVIVIAPKLRQK